MTDDPSIRSARPEDADRAAVLLYSAYTHQQVSYPLPEDGENRFVERLKHFFREAGNRFSYQNIQVAEQQGEVVGLVLSFGGREEERLNSAIGWPLERRRRRMSGMLMPWLSSPTGATRASARACCKRPSSRHASTAMQRSRSMWHERTSKPWLCINAYSMWSPVRPSSITIPMYAWSSDWTTRDTGHAARERGAYRTTYIGRCNQESIGWNSPSSFILQQSALETSNTVFLSASRCSSLYPLGRAAWPWVAPERLFRGETPLSAYPVGRRRGWNHGERCRPGPAHSSIRDGSFQLPALHLKASVFVPQ